MILSAFIIVCANSVQTTKKPFNPVLGETFEYIDRDFGTKVILEQVSHHPPISAFYCDNEEFTIEGWFGIKTIF